MPFIQLQFRRGTASQWTSSNPVLADGELAIESDTKQIKIGNGIAAWIDLSYGGIQGPTGNLSNTVTFDVSFNAFCNSTVSSAAERFTILIFFSERASRIKIRLLILFEAGSVTGFSLIFSGAETRTNFRFI